ncbi:MAG: hypothetical protein A2000_10500 [Ignavibacteria bacterium GWB2_36_8]|nr:MAG: hypothetical protein A2000_10500 [Ignavibacteria bacterium GWB2_36_8]OGU51376.1 MAG: hypothetical protein A2080_00940 [Ignavibacteria bacterium GWC2_36_12]OGU98496.1 MAG: hypothetical protein A2330_04970 [Ignavibacteria bacterium RIFOXYB2_FULL_36_7]
MDSTETSFISYINSYMPLLALVVSIAAIYISYRAYKRTEIISKPVIAGRYTRGKSFVLHIEDYSPNRNLRIDSVYFKPLNKYKYYKIEFGTNNLHTQNPPVIEVLIDDEFVWNTGVIKVETSVTTLYEYVNSLFEEADNKWYRIIRNFRYKRLLKKYNTQFQNRLNI